MHSCPMPLTLFRSVVAQGASYAILTTIRSHRGCLWLISVSSSHSRIASMMYSPSSSLFVSPAKELSTSHWTACQSCPAATSGLAMRFIASRDGRLFEVGIQRLCITVSSAFSPPPQAVQKRVYSWRIAFFCAFEIVTFRLRFFLDDLRTGLKSDPGRHTGHRLATVASPCFRMRKPTPSH